MKGLKAKDLLGNDVEELKSTIRKLEEDLFKHKMKKVVNQLENTMLVRNVRRDIARVKTVLSQKQRQAAAQTTASAPAGTK